MATPSGVKKTPTSPLPSTVAVGVARAPPIVKFEAGCAAAVSPPLTVEVVERLKVVAPKVWGVGFVTFATVSVTAVLAAIAHPEPPKVTVYVVLVVPPLVAVQLVEPVPPVMETTELVGHVKLEGNVSTIVLEPPEERAPCAEVVKPTVHVEVSSPADEAGENVTAVGVVAVIVIVAGDVDATAGSVNAVVAD